MGQGPVAMVNLVKLREVADYLEGFAKAKPEATVARTSGGNLGIPGGTRLQSFDEIPDRDGPRNPLVCAHRL
jgi:hypothetical protein